MAQVPNDPVQVQEGDIVQLVLGKIAELRARLLKLRGSSQKEYDRVLKQGFPLDVLALLEAVALDYGNRTAALAYRFDELAIAVLPDEGDDEGEDEDEGEDAGGAAEIEAARVLVQYLEGLPDLPPNVVEAVTLLKASDLFAKDDDEPEDDAPEESPEDVKPEEKPEEEQHGEVVDETPGVGTPEPTE